MDSVACFMVDDLLLDFASDIGEEDDDEDQNNRKPSTKPALNVLDSHETACTLPEFAEEELEWLSNKDAFPSVETFVDILSDHPNNHLPKQQSPVSVLETTTTTSSTTSTTTTGSGGGGGVGRGSSIVMSCCGSLRFPVRARSKRRCRRLRREGHDPWWSSKEIIVKSVHKNGSRTSGGGAAIGRKCLHCGSEKTPQWRAGPMGPKTLCNACGVRFKSGRLVPEYRPASSPSFSSDLHSNSHRKVLEMRRKKQMMGMMVVKACSVDKG